MTMAVSPLDVCPDGKHYTPKCLDMSNGLDTSKGFDAAVASSVWSFGFGSNMDVEALATKKGLHIMEHVPAIVKGWRISFSIRGIPLVEPAFATVDPGSQEDEIHGVAFRIPLSDVPVLDKVESGYEKAFTSYQAYDGRTLHGYLYTSKPGAKLDNEGLPSKRYLGVLLKGARQAGLNEEYIEKLSRMPTYSPSEETLQVRSKLPAPLDLPAMSVDELHAKAEDGDNCYVAVMGYVMCLPKSKVFFQSHKGRDITARQLRQARGLPLDAGDDMGRPPFPKQEEISADEEEFIKTWLDSYFIFAGGANVSCIQGFLSEFLAQRQQEGYA